MDEGNGMIWTVLVMSAVLALPPAAALYYAWCLREGKGMVHAPSASYLAPYVMEEQHGLAAGTRVRVMTRPLVHVPDVPVIAGSALYPDRGPMRWYGDAPVCPKEALEAVIADDER